MSGGRESEYGLMGHGLTERDIQILTLLSEGLMVQEIAPRVFLAPSTVKNTLMAIYDYLGVRNGAGAVGAAFRKGLIS